MVDVNTSDNDMANAASDNTPAAPLPVEGVGKEKVEALVNIARPQVIMEEVDFGFRKDELGNKRPTVTLNIPFVTVDGLAAGLADEKIQQYLLDIVNADIVKNARAQVSDETKPVNSQAELDISKLTLEFLANMPAAERRGGGIAKETWEAFGKDYLAIMPALLDKPEENIQNAVTLFLKKFQPVKTNKNVLKLLRDYLALWFANTQNAEEFAECYSFLDNKAETLLAADEASLLANL